MLKSTHQKAAPPVQNSSTPTESALPPGWTAHVAPTGHTYYYNASLKKSTYTRPAPPPAAPTPAPIPSYGAGEFASGFSASAFPSNARSGGTQRGGARGAHRGGARGGGGGRGGRFSATDRPKHRADVPGCAPWVLVTTRLGRRFVHNKETAESFWRFPDEVLQGVMEMDQAERERREREGEERVEEEKKEEDEEGGEESEYTEVEVTDDEGPGQEDDDGPSKRLKSEANNQPVEFDEDDLARELEDMGQEFGSEFGDDDYQDEGDGLTEEDCKMLFYELLEDFKVSPFSTWETIIDEGKIIEDSRYTALSSMKARRAAWDEWTRKKIQDVKEAREKEEKKDPRIAYYVFLEEYATPKLYWPEFKRKYRKEAPMKDSKVTDKDREKWYREYIKRLQLPQSTLKSDFTTLLKSLPVSVLNRNTSMHQLPAALLTDLRFISIPRTLRDPLLEAYLTTLPAAPAADDAASANEPQDAETADRERRQRALAERERRVDEEKRRQRRNLSHGKAMLRAEEAEVERAMRVGRGGLRSHMDEPMDEEE